LNLSFTPRSEGDLDAIFNYIAKDDAEAARRVIARLLQAIAILERFPLLGRVGRVAGTRELTIVRLPYYAVYHLVNETEIEVIAVIHERRIGLDIPTPA
jgi:addiction module RelE/StbE family toxin